jgi:hypothetical protein
MKMMIVWRSEVLHINQTPKSSYFSNTQKKIYSNEPGIFYIQLTHKISTMGK